MASLTQAANNPTAGNVPGPSEFIANPFSTKFVCPGAIPYQFPCRGSERELAEKLRRVRFGAIVGPHGTGKSTLIRSLRSELTTQFLHIAEIQLHGREAVLETERLAFTASLPWSAFRHARVQAKSVVQTQRDLPADGLLIVDGGEQLSTLARWGVIRTARNKNQTVLITCHRDLAGVQTLYRTSIDPDLVRKLADQLLLGATPQQRRVVDDVLAQQDWSKLTNLRDFWFELYDRVQDSYYPPNSDGSTNRDHGAHRAADSLGTETLGTNCR